MKTKLISQKGWLAAPALAIAAACVLFAQPVLAQTRAALVQSIDEPGRNPYQELQASITCRGRKECSLQFAPIPAGKRLVLTHINGYVDVTNGSLPDVYIGAGYNTIPPILVTATSARLVFTGVRGPTSSQSGTRIFINHRVQAYFVSGEIPGAHFGVPIFDDSVSGVVQLMLTGYFVNVP